MAARWRCRRARRPPASGGLLAGQRELANPRSNKCLTAPGGGNGDRITVGTCTGGPRQSWTLPAGPVISSISGKCLADPGNSSATGTRVGHRRVQRGARPEVDPDPRWPLKINGKCLAVVGNATISVLVNGAPVQLANCDSRLATQVWARDSRGQLLNGQSGRCLAVPAGTRHQADPGRTARPARRGLGGQLAPWSARGAHGGQLAPRAASTAGR